MTEVYTLKIADTPAEIELIRKYSDQVFKDDGVAITGIQETDLLPKTRIFYATDSDCEPSLDSICGTIRYTLDSEEGLPFDKAIFLDAHTPGHKKNDWKIIENSEHALDISSLREGRLFNPELVNFGMLAIDTRHRVTARIYEILLKLCVVHSIKHGAKKAVISVNHAIERTMKKFGFTRFHPERLYSPLNKNYIVVMAADLTAPFFSRLDLKLPDNVSIFAGSEIFKIYPRNAVICRQGDIRDKKVYLVVSGSVKIEVETEHERKRIALIGPGEIFGEMALIDRKARSADVLANHRHVILQELTNLDENVISKTPEIFFEFASMLSRRIRALNEKFKNSSRFLPEKYEQMPLPKTLSDFIRQKDERKFSKSEMLCRQGEKGQEMYIISQGTIAISIELPGGDEMLLGFAHEGSLVGEMALIENDKRSASMTACEIVHAIEIKKEELTELIREDWRVGHFMLRTIVQKLRVNDRLIAGSLMIRKNVVSEFKQKLLSMSDEESLMGALNESFGDNRSEEALIYDLKWLSEALGVPQKDVTPWLEQLKACKALYIHPATGKISVLDASRIENEKLIYDLTM